MTDLKALESELHRTQPQQAREHVEGWPSDIGPLADLHRLGLHADTRSRPKWASWPKMQTLEDGRTQYRASSKTLFEDATRALAALSLEGYQIRLSPWGKEIQIDITEAS